MRKNLQAFLEEKVMEYNRPSFIEYDPISIPHMFSKKQDIEISGFFAAILAWGQRKTILKKCKELMELMDNSPYEFILYHQKEKQFSKNARSSWSSWIILLMSLSYIIKKRI